MPQASLVLFGKSQDDFPDAPELEAHLRFSPMRKKETPMLVKWAPLPLRLKLRVIQAQKLGSNSEVIGSWGSAPNPESSSITGN